MARKKKHEEHENHERWLVSYADFITLLFAFFVVMYSVSSVNEGKYRVLSDALLAAFRSPQKTLTPIQVGNPAKAPKAESMEINQVPSIVAARDLPRPDVTQGKKKGGAASSPLAEIADRAEEELARLIDEDLIAVRYNDDFAEIEIKSEILFPAGGTKLTDEAKMIIGRLARILRAVPNLIKVEGFTDNTAINSKIYPSNWELSAARSGAVVRLFADKRIDPTRMAAVGYGEFQPIADNATAEGRNRNRRVSIVVLNQTMMGELREDLVLASFPEDEASQPDLLNAEAGEDLPGGEAALEVQEPVEEVGWKQPVDVTAQPVTDTGAVIDLSSPFQVITPMSLDVAPPEEHGDSVKE